MLQCFCRVMTRTRKCKQEHEKSAFSFLECLLPPARFSLIQNALSHNTGAQGQASANSGRLLNSMWDIYCSNFSKLRFFSTAHGIHWHYVFKKAVLRPEVLQSDEER